MVCTLYLAISKQSTFVPGQEWAGGMVSPKSGMGSAWYDQMEQKYRKSHPTMTATVWLWDIII